MATPLTAGYLYILTTEQADPDNYDLDGMAEGQQFVYFIPIRIVDALTTMKEPDQYPGGGTHIKALGYQVDKAIITGRISESTVALTMSRVSKWKRFVFEEATDTSLYLVCKWANSNYWPWYDTDGDAEAEYCQGAFVDNDITFKWYSDKKFFVEVQFTWRANW